MLPQFREPDAWEAGENLRVIREVMERSTKYSTFSGVSGILAGLASIAGCLATRRFCPDPNTNRSLFLTIWTLVICFAIGADYLLTKRRAASVGKHIISHLGKQMAFGAIPGLGSGALLTLFFMRHQMLGLIYPIWMLCYGVAVCSVGLFSQREVRGLGAAFLLAGAVTMLLSPHWGLMMMAVSFGGFHILYGIFMSRKDGW